MAGYAKLAGGIRRAVHGVRTYDPGCAMGLLQRNGSGSFLKKRTKTLFLLAFGVRVDFGLLHRTALASAKIKRLAVRWRDAAQARDTKISFFYFLRSNPLPGSTLSKQGKDK
jgi:hypothetical protein